MALSVLDIFKVGIGPSSSHTVGPMKAAHRFVQDLDLSSFPLGWRIQVELFGSLALTGKGHGIDRALLLGLEGQSPEEVDPDYLFKRSEEILRTRELIPWGCPKGQVLAFDPDRDFVYVRTRTLPLHSNALKFLAISPQGQTLAEKIFYSVGGGFVLDEGGRPLDGGSFMGSPPFAFHSAEELLGHCRAQGLSISSLMILNEEAQHQWNRMELFNRILHIWKVMESSIERGCHQEGVLPGRLRVVRRAPHLFRKLRTQGPQKEDPLVQLDWANLYAMAVGEENAAGGRVVTAPTNGAAGIIPSVLSFLRNQMGFLEKGGDEIVIRFLLTAGAIGILYKENASISGAEVGCQGEVGVACSMAAGALAEILGGSPDQVENAAEIGMEHNLGLTCDPVDGLVQIPCIERNAMGAVKAINAARLALQGDGRHKVSLDGVIATMKATGEDMRTQYKETALGGLAVQVGKTTSFCSLVLWAVGFGLMAFLLGLGFFNSPARCEISNVLEVSSSDFFNVFKASFHPSPLSEDPRDKMLDLPGSMSFGFAYRTYGSRSEGAERSHEIGGHVQWENERLWRLGLGFEMGYATVEKILRYKMNYSLGLVFELSEVDSADVDPEIQIHLIGGKQKSYQSANPSDSNWNDSFNLWNNEGTGEILIHTNRIQVGVSYTRYWYDGFFSHRASNVVGQTTSYVARQGGVLATAFMYYPDSFKHLELEFFLKSGKSIKVYSSEVCSVLFSSVSTAFGVQMFWNPSSSWDLVGGVGYLNSQDRGGSPALELGFNYWL